MAAQHIIDQLTNTEDLAMDFIETEVGHHDWCSNLETWFNEHGVDGVVSAVECWLKTSGQDGDPDAIVAYLKRMMAVHGHAAWT